MPDQPSDPPRPATRAERRALDRSSTTDVEEGADAVAGAAAAPEALPAGAQLAGWPFAVPAPEGSESVARGPEAVDREEPVVDPAAVGATPPPPPHVARTDWRLGGRTVRRWREWLLAGAFLSIGIAILAGAALVLLWPSPWAAPVATLLLWIGMLIPIVRAFSRSRPAGLLRFRPLDLLFAVGLGCLLRVAQGWIATAVDGRAPFPSYPLVDGRLPDQWVLMEVVGPIVIAPVVEELFFHGVLLVALYTVLRRALGYPAAGVIAWLVTTGAFVLVHGMTGATTVADSISLTLLAAVCGALVLMTGRIWAAILTHAVFNATFVVLALVGTFWT